MMGDQNDKQRRCFCSFMGVAERRGMTPRVDRVKPGPERRAPTDDGYAVIAGVGSSEGVRASVNRRPFSQRYLTCNGGRVNWRAIHESVPRGCEACRRVAPTKSR